MTSPVVSQDEEAGFAGGFEGLLFGVLLFVVGTLLVANAWGVVDTKMALDQAAREGVRTYVEAPDAAQAYANAVRASDQSLRGAGRNPADARIVIGGGPFVRCSRITVTVSMDAPYARLPFVGSVGGGGESVSASNSELVDPLRSGLGGVATCA